jgi:protein-S-isoprenylcysteine O-methyltransferase Ste14
MDGERFKDITPENIFLGAIPVMIAMCPFSMSYLFPTDTTSFELRVMIVGFTCTFLAIIFVLMLTIRVQRNVDILKVQLEKRRK